METSVPTSSVIKRKAIVLVDCSPETAYTYISGSTELPDWLRKSGPISGAKSVDIIDGPYNRPGAQRIVLFQNGDTVQEELLTCTPFSNYAYRVTAFSDFLAKLTDMAFGQFWFERLEGQTRITWMYSYTYTNKYSRLVLWLFNELFFKKFMQSGLNNAKVQLEQRSLKA